MLRRTSIDDSGDYGNSQAKNVVQHSNGKSATNTVKPVWHGTRHSHISNSIMRNGSAADVEAHDYNHDDVVDTHAWEDCGCVGPTPSCDTAMGMACPRARFVHAVAGMPLVSLLHTFPRTTFGLNVGIVMPARGTQTMALLHLLHLLHQGRPP